VLLAAGCWPYKATEVWVVGEGGAPSDSPYACVVDESIPPGGAVSGVRCVGNPAQECTGGIGGATGDGGCYAFFLCPLTCTTAADCPDPGGGRLTPTCDPGGGICSLRCHSHADCPDGMLCDRYSNTPEDGFCLWGFGAQCPPGNPECCGDR
jgi:hypothetical protein